MNRMRHGVRGFTLIELLLVMVILTILASVVTVQWSKHIDKVRNSAAKADVSQLETAVSAFQLDCGRFPSDAEGLDVLSNDPGIDGWDGPYVKFVPNDPWKNPYVYQAPGEHLPTLFDLHSLGKDGEDGTEDDVVNWKM